MSEIQILINDIIRLINGSRRSEKKSIEELSRGIQWASFNRLAITSTLNDTWKMLNKGSAEDNKFSINYDRRTRAAEKGDIKTAYSGVSQFLRNGMILYNHKNFSKVRDAQDIETVKKYIAEKIENFPF